VLSSSSFFLLFFISSPNLSRHRLDVYHTSTHGVALVQISDAGLKRAARGSLKIQDDKSRQKSPSAHHRTTLSGYIFATEVYIDNLKKHVKKQYLLHSTCPHNMANFGLLTAEISWPVSGTPAYFNGFRILTALLHGTPVVGVSQTLRRWTEDATYIRQGDHHVGQWPTFLVTTFSGQPG